MLGVQQVIIAMPSSSHQQRKRAIQLCNAAKVKALTVPSFDDLISGKVAVSQLCAIELDDLLGRDPVVLDDAWLHGLLTAKVVMVAGTGGSIGYELCRQIVRFAPAKLMLFEQDAARGLVLAYLVNCLFNSPLLDHADGPFFAFMAAVLFANLKPALSSVDVTVKHG